jgi:hypothetical protein
MIGCVKGLFWNCRGIKKKDLAPFIRDMIHEKGLDFLCFQETIMQDFPESCLRQVDPNKCYLWDWIPARGRSGGILSGLKLDRFDVGSSILEL